MTLTTALTKRLNCRHPIISAGMGGPARSELAAAVSEAGGFGLLGMVRETPDLIAREISEVRRRTSRPFGVNLIPFATDPKLLHEELAVCLDAFGLSVQAETGERILEHRANLKGPFVARSGMALGASCRGGRRRWRPFVVADGGTEAA